MLAPVKSKYRPAGQAVHRLCSCTSSDRAETNPGFSPYLPTGQFLHWDTRNNPSTSEYVPAGQFLHWVTTSVAASSVEYLPCRRETKQTNQATQPWQLIIDAVRPTVFSALVGARRSTTKKEGSHVPNGQPWQECTQDQETLRVMLRWYTTVLGFRSTPLYELHPISVPYLPALPWKKEKNRKLARTRQATQFMKQ